MNASAPRVLVALKRPADYSDVHAELVAEDAMRPGHGWELIRDDGAEVIVAIERPEEYERTAAKTLASELISPTWPSWRIVKQ
jgi:hypothetical protein